MKSKKARREAQFFPEETMRKIITATVFSLALASTALAQEGNSGSQNSSDDNHMRPPQQAEPLIKGDGTGATDPTTTQSTTGGTGSQGATGQNMSGQNMSDHGNMEKCHAGAPTGGDTQAMPGASQSVKPNCP
jgi:hypothetical protein